MSRLHSVRSPTAVAASQDMSALRVAMIGTLAPRVNGVPSWDPRSYTSSMRMTARQALTLSGRSVYSRMSARSAQKVSLALSLVLQASKAWSAQLVTGALKASLSQTIAHQALTLMRLVQPLRKIALLAQQVITAQKALLSQSLARQAIIAQLVPALRSSLMVVSTVTRTPTTR